MEQRLRDSQEWRRITVRITAEFGLVTMADKDNRIVVAIG